MMTENKCFPPPNGEKLIRWVELGCVADLRHFPPAARRCGFRRIGQ
jgi:hypothetical protein